MTPVIRLNDAQRAAARTERHCLVSAGAGTGKTTTVVERIAWVLGLPDADGACRAGAPLELGQVAAITFTVQAAADLKRKLRDRLRAGGRRDLAAEVDAARIGTIHGFCGTVLDEFALRAGLPPRRDVLDEADGVALRHEVATDTVVAALDGGDPRLARLLGTRRLADVAGWVAALIADRARLEGYAHATAPEGDEGALLALAQRASEGLARRLDELGAIDFDRMILDTRDLVRDHEAVRRALQSRLRLLVVDEFQDVDPAQEELAWRLAEPESGRDDTPRLLLVGDPKQSIYRFRRADVTVWTRVARRFAEPAVGEVVTLDENRRSVPGVLGFVDATVGPLLDAPVDGATRHDFEVDFIPLRPVRAAVDAAPAVECLVVPAGDDGKARTADAVRASDAAAVARHLRALLDEAARVEPAAEDPAAPRPLRPGDIAILLASWKDAPRWRAALREVGIAAAFARERGFWERREVLDLLLALRVVRDPHDDVALAGMLRGPWGAVPDDLLLRLRHRAAALAPAASLWTALGDFGAPLPAGAERVRRLVGAAAARRDRVPLRALAEFLLLEGGVLARHAACGEAGRQAAANLRRLLRRLDDLGDRTLGHALRAIAELRDAGVEEGDEPLDAGRDDVVTITSIHGAKGLEWRVVVWADLVREDRARHDALQLGRTRFALKPAEGEEDDDAPSPHAVLKAEIALEEHAERARLWYVALTRARDRLILSGLPAGAPRGAGSAARWLREAIPALGEAEPPAVITLGEGVPCDVAVTVVPPVDPEAVVPVEVEPVPAGAEGVVRPPDPVPLPERRARTSFTQEKLRAEDPARWRRRYLQGLPDDGVGAARGRRALGVLVHALLDDPDADLPADAALRAAGEALAAEVRAHPRYAALEAAPTRITERRFVHLRADGAVVEGAFDLAAIEDGVVRILDVKTGRLDVAGAAAAYALQGAIYTEAAEAITGLPARFELLLAGSGESVSLP